jgi:hypothetical protein
MLHPLEIDYPDLLADRALEPSGWSAVVAAVLVPVWLAAYRGTTIWDSEVIEVVQGGLVYLFDAAPTLHRLDAGDDRVVAVWGLSSAPTSARDGGRLAGFLAGRSRWSGRKTDRGHLVAHSAGGGLDMNLVPQAAAVNRGRGEQGKRWRAIERHIATHPGTPLFVRPTYHDGTWVPIGFDYGLVVKGVLRVERFTNTV